MVISHLTGKRDYAGTNDFAADLVFFSSAGHGSNRLAAHPDAICAHLLGRLNFAVLQKVYGKPENTLQKFNPNHRYSQPKCMSVELRTVAGVPDVDKICTSHVERLNLTVRTFNKRFTRVCVGCSRKLDNQRHFVALIRHGLQLLQSASDAWLHASFRRKASRP